jgi:uncharacterized membrane protein YfcA
MFSHPLSWHLAILVAVAFFAGAQNALAGGGSFLTFPALLFMGLDPRAANITSTIGLFPGQLTTAYAGRSLVQGAAGLSVWRLVAISIVGGGLGAVLLLATPVSVFVHLVPWLVLFATLVFAWGSFRPRRNADELAARLTPGRAMAAQAAIAVYGGYFGGGIGILMLAALTAVGMAVRPAGATKNLLAGVINIAAVAIFLLRAPLNWHIVVPFAVAAIAGGQAGVVLLRHIDERLLRVVVTCVGLALTVGLFIRA